MRALVGYCFTALLSLVLVGVLAYTLWPVVEAIGSLGKTLLQLLG